MTDFRHKSLSSQIEEILGLKKHTEKFDIVFLHCLEYLCLETKIKEFHSNLSAHVDFSKLDVTPSKFRLALAQSGYLLLNLRFFTIYASVMPNRSSTSFDYYSSQHDIDAEDSMILEELITTPYKSGSSNRSILTRIRKCVPRKNLNLYAPEEITEVINEFNHMMPEIKKQINRNIYKYLRFIKKSYNITHDEFVSELLFSAIKAQYKSKPNKNGYEKQLNKIRASVHNAAINIIKQYTTTKRERLVNEGQDAQGQNVFSLRTVSENQMSLSALKDSDVEVEYHSMFSSSLRLQMEKHAESEYSVNQLIEKYGPRSVKTRLLRAFFFPDCYMLNAWLVKKKLLRSQTKTTRDFLDSKSREEHLDILSAYLGIDKDTLVDKALPSLAKVLGIL